MRRVFSVLLAGGLLLAAARPARADVTAFVGANLTPDNRLARGFAVGAGLLIIGFEAEYSNSSEDAEHGSPSLRVFSGNVLLQTPFMVAGFQPYFTAGLGGYREELDTREDTGFTTNLGGGVKVALAGPLRLRLDYRVFKLGSEALHSPAHRVYAGLNVRF